MSEPKATPSEKPRARALDDVLTTLVERVQSTTPLSTGPIAEEMLALFAGSKTLSGAEQVEIYREQYWLRHERALTEDFPGLSGLLASSWPQVVQRYLVSHPLRSFTLRDLGQQLPEFIAAEFDGQPLFSDMARLEWSYVEAFDAADAPPVSGDLLTSLSEADWEKAKLRLSPSLRLLELSFPVHEYRRSLRRGEPLDAAPMSVCLAVYRHPNLSVYDKPLPVLALRLLERLGRGEPLGTACDALAAEEEATAVLEENLGRWFQSFGEMGLIVGVDADP